MISSVGKATIKFTLAVPIYNSHESRFCLENNVLSSDQNPWQSYSFLLCSSMLGQLAGQMSHQSIDLIGHTLVAGVLHEAQKDEKLCHHHLVVRPPYQDIFCLAFSCESVTTFFRVISLLTTFYLQKSMQECIAI